VPRFLRRGSEVDPDAVYQAFEQAWSLLEEGKSDRGLAAMKRLAAAYSSSVDADVRWWVNQALLTEANYGLVEGRPADALAACDTVLARLGKAAVDPSVLASDPGGREQLARTMKRRAQALCDLDRLDEALDGFDALSSRFEADEEPGVQPHIAGGLTGRAQALAGKNDLDGALAVLDELLARFADAPRSETRAAVARGLLYKGELLLELGQLEQARQAYDAVVERFGGAAEPSTTAGDDAWESLVRESVAYAQSQRDFTVRSEGDDRAN